MTDKEFVLTTMREYGMRRAQDLQETSEGMTGTDFSAAVAKKNMLERKAGKTDGFLCRSSAGRIVRLIQNYNSDRSRRNCLPSGGSTGRMILRRPSPSSPCPRVRT